MPCVPGGVKIGCREHRRCTRDEQRQGRQESHVLVHSHHPILLALANGAAQHARRSIERSLLLDRFAEWVRYVTRTALGNESEKFERECG
jgi:hypothetical protein